MSLAIMQYFFKFSSGHGFYNYFVLAACCVISNAVAIDMFGFSIIVAAATCDLQISIVETGILASAPFAGSLFHYNLNGITTDSPRHKPNMYSPLLHASGKLEDYPLIAEKHTIISFLRAYTSYTTMFHCWRAVW